MTWILLLVAVLIIVPYVAAVLSLNAFRSDAWIWGLCYNIGVLAPFAWAIAVAILVGLGVHWIDHHSILISVK